MNIGVFGLFFWLWGGITAAQVREELGVPKLEYEAIPDSFQLAAGENFVELAGYCREF